ncbi:ABC transporter permease [Paenibacillus sp. IB182496]|uniref:ABC transporter permease n=1 Tax=Paenibacillus sabuli TaxID=2772509 RepID=A0A927BQ83_9BACL|nr:ABC transporter permease [Paenibacillus sabuli]MBD2843755.1 ABC transporter permease [Paenibacillus sabuli]
MKEYLVKKAWQLIPTVLGVVTLVFIVMRLIPGDATSHMAGDNLSGDALNAMRERMGLDVPIWQQYFNYLLQLVRLDLGTTMVTGQPVAKLILEALPVTFLISVLTVGISCLVAITLGTLAAFTAHKGKKLVDSVLTWITMLVDLMPSFWMALLLMLLFTLTLGWLPATGSIDYGDPLGLLRRIALPLIVLCMGQISTIARITRTSVLEVLNEDYIRTARAFGAPQLLVVFRHALKNAAMPIITVAGLAFGSLMNGTVITEFIFSIPGIGSLLIGGIKMRDYTLVQSVILVYSMLFIVVNMMTDLIYRYMDPRVKY